MFVKGEQTITVHCHTHIFPVLASWKVKIESLADVTTVRAENLKREFNSKRGKVVALDSVSFDVKEGEIFGLLGPNGAGKTTLVRILSTLLLPTSGRATIMNHDVAKQPEKVRPLISMVSGSERASYDFITARRNMWFFSQLYGIASDEAMMRIESLSSALSLDGYLDNKMYTLSAGYRQRLAIARAFINDPKVLFMDEPTVGLDVMTARSIRDFIVAQASEKKRTVFLATHNMVEADSMCDRVAIIDKGKILACDSPVALKRSLGTPALVLEVSPPPSSFESFSSISGVKGLTSSTDAERGVAKIKAVIVSEDASKQLRSKIESAGMKILSSWEQEPTLEEVFVGLVGRGFVEREV